MQRLPLSDRLVNIPLAFHDSDLNGQWVGVGEDQDGSRWTYQPCGRVSHWSQPEERADLWDVICSVTGGGGAGWPYSSPTGTVVLMGVWHAIGLVLEERLGLVMLDMDDCLDDCGAPNADALEMIERFPGYWERSRSGRGLHAIVRAFGLRSGWYRLRGGTRLEVHVRGLACLTLDRVHEAGDDVRGHESALQEYLGTLHPIDRSCGAASALAEGGLAGGPIEAGGRNDALARIGLGLLRQGMPADQLPEALRRINEARCLPQLDDREVDGIAASVARTYDRREARFRQAEVRQNVREAFIIHTSDAAHRDGQDGPSSLLKDVRTSATQAKGRTPGEASGSIVSPDVANSHPALPATRKRLRASRRVSAGCSAVGLWSFNPKKGRTRGTLLCCSDFRCARCAPARYCVWTDRIVRFADGQLIYVQRLTAEELRRYRSSSVRRMDREENLYQIILTDYGATVISAGGRFALKAADPGKPLPFSGQERWDAVRDVLMEMRFRRKKGEHLRSGSVAWSCPAIRYEPQPDSDEELLGVGPKPEAAAVVLSHQGQSFTLADQREDALGQVYHAEIVTVTATRGDAERIVAWLSLSPIGRKRTTISHPGGQ